MAFYASAEQFYTCIQSLFERVLEESPDTARAILAARMIIRLRCSAPEAEITLNGRAAPVQTTCGPSALRPDLDISLAADTLHAILLDHISLRKALAGGQLKVKGPIWKTTALAELLRQGRAHYSDILRQNGLPGPGPT